MSSRLLSRVRHLGGAAVDRAESLALRGARWYGRERFPDLPSDEEVLAELRSRALVITSSDEPEVTIIVPVYGKFATTWACLESLSTVPAGASFEVIVADDRSPDQTPQMLERVRGARVTTNPQNLGFLRSNNHAATLARGKWLCLLNNDTRTTEGWLGELLRTFDVFPSAGLVGAKLLFSDGRLQEAGSIVFGDGIASQYGRNRDPSRPEFCYARRVDYCSAACVLIRRSLWEELGGFDELFVPAYYEDTDLAFRVRQAGLDVVYQPLARIVHYEGITHGRNLKRGLKAYQVQNHARFHDRWRDVLAREHSPAHERNWRTANRRRGPGVLALTDVEPDSGTAVYDALLAADSAGWRVSVWAAEPGAGGAARSELQRRGIEVLYAPYVVAPKDLLRSSPPGRFSAVLLCGAPHASSTAALTGARALEFGVFVLDPSSAVGDGSERRHDGSVETWRALAAAART